MSLSPMTAGRSPILRREVRPGRVVVLALVAMVLVAVAGLALRHGDDAGALVALNRWHVGVVGAVASAAYNVLEPVPSVLLTVVATALLWWRRRDLRLAGAFAGTVALTWIPSDLLKLVVGRPRPDHALLPHPFQPLQTDPSYPSGHTVFVVAFALALSLALRDTRWRHLVVGLAALFVVVLMVSVLIDGIHYPTDVLASVVWGVAVFPAARWLWVDVILRRIPLPWASAPVEG